MQAINQAPNLSQENDKENEDNQALNQIEKQQQKKAFSLNYLKQNIQKMIIEQRRKFKEVQKQDQFCELSCSAECVINILEVFKQNLNQIIETGNQDILNRLFVQIYNCSNDLFQYCMFLKQSYYRKFILEYLEYISKLMQKNDVLCSAKYLEQILKFDFEIISILENENQIQQALEYIQSVQIMIQTLYQKSLDRKLDNFKEGYENYQRLINLYLIKLQIVLKQIPKNQLQKQLETTFDDKSSRIQIVLESIQLCKNLQNQKQQNFDDLIKDLTDFIIEYTKNDTQNLCLLLQQKKDLLFEPYLQQIQKLKEPEQIDQKVNKKQDKNNKKQDPVDVEQIDKQINDKSENFHLNQHVELMTIFFNLNDQKNFDYYYEQAIIRLQNYNIERQFLEDINFLISKKPNPQVPDGYQIINIDINQAFLIDEIDRVRNKQKKFTITMDDKPKETQTFTTDMGIEYTEEELQQTEHRFVYIIYKKTFDASKTIIDLQLKMEDEFKGPIEYLEKDYEVIQVPINQYRGVQATYQTVPFLCIKHVDNQIQNQQKQNYNWRRGKNKTKFLQPIIYEQYLKEKKQQEQIKLQQTQQQQEQNQDQNEDQNLDITEEEKQQIQEEIQKQKDEQIFQINKQIETLKNQINMNNEYINSQINYFIEDLKPLFSNSFHVRSQFKYKQIPLELRQVPKEFINLENKTYLYFFQKQQTNYYYNKRLLKLMKSYVDFKQSYQEQKGKQQKNTQDVCRVMLNFYFKEDFIQNFVDEFENFVKLLKNDKNFQKQYLDQTYQIGLDFWTNYIKPFLVQFEFYDFSIFNQTLLKEQQQYFKQILNQKIKSIFIKCLLTLIDLCDLHQLQKDIVLESTITLFLSKIFEIDSNYTKAYEILKQVNKKINIYRDWKASNFLQKNQEYLLPLSSTCNNLKIAKCFQAMKENLQKYKQKVYSSISKQYTDVQQNQELIEQQKQLEKFENKIFFKELLKYDIDTEYYMQQIQHQNYSEYDLIVINIQCEILYCLSRCFLLIPFQQQSKQDTFKDMSTSFQKLLSYKNQQSQLQIYNKTHLLKNSLQEAKEIPQDKIKFKRNEKSLLKIASNNKYLRAIFMSTIAIIKDDTSEQEQLLQKSLQVLDQQVKYEQSLLDLAVQNSQYIFKYSLKNENRQQIEDPLLQCLDEGITEKERKNPKSPVILKLNRKSITICFPYFKPQLSQQLPSSYKKQKQTSYISIFGSMINKNSKVSKLSDQLQKTGILIDPKRMVKIDQLIPNKKYQFALLASDSNRQEINSLGDLSPILYTVLPMPLQNLYAHVGKCAFLLRNYKLSVKAFQASTQSIITQIFNYEQNFRQISQNFQFYKINRQSLVYYSIPEIVILSESTYLQAQSIYFYFCERIKQNQKRYNIFKLQMKILQIVELFLIAAELSITSKYFQISILSITAAFNNLGLFLKENNLPFQILNLLLKLHNLLALIPDVYFNNDLSIISNKIYYYLINACFQNQQSILILKSISIDLDIQRKILQIYPVQNQENNQLTFLLKNLENFEISIKFFEFFLLINSKLINQIDYYEEQFQKNIQDKEELDEKYLILQKIRNLRDFIDYQQDQKNTVVNIQKRFQGNELKNFMLKYIQIQSLRDYDIDFEQIDDTFINFKEYEEIINIIELKQKLIEYDVQWNNIEIYDDTINLDQVKKEDLSDKFNEFLIKKQLLQEYKQLIKEDNIQNIYGSYDNKNNQYLAYYLYYKVQFLAKKYEKNYKIVTRENYDQNLFLLNFDSIKQEFSQEEIIDQDEDEEKIKMQQELFQTIYHCMVFSYISQQLETLKNCLMFCLNFVQKVKLGNKSTTSQQLKHYLLLINEISFETFSKINKQKMTLKSTEDNLSQTNIDLIDLVQTKEIQTESLVYTKKEQYWVNLFVLNIQLNLNKKNPNFILYLAKKLFINNKQKKLVRLMQYLTRICKSQNQSIENIIQQEESELKKINEKIIKNQSDIEKMIQQNKDKSSNETIEEQSKNQFEENQNLEEQNNILKHQQTIQNKFIEILKQTYNHLMNEFELYQNMHSQMNLQIAKNDLVFAQVLDQLKILYKNNKIFKQDNLQDQSQSKEIIYKLKNDVIEIQKKKNSYHNLVISLNTLGEFYYKLKDKDMAEENWREALDSVFQKLKVLDNQNEIFKKLPFEDDLVQKFNARSLHITIVICYRLSEYIYYNKLEKQRQCLQLVNNVIFHLLSKCLPHPLILEDFKNYKLQSNLFPCIFQNPIILRSDEFVKALKYFAQMNTIYQNHLQNLPIFCYLEYLSEHQIFSIYENLLSRYGKIITLAQTGFIDEAIINYRDLCLLKYLPQFYGAQNFLKQQNQGYFEIEDFNHYQNDVTPFDERNKKQLELFSNIDQSKILNLLQNQKIELLILFKTLKPLIYKSIYKNQNIEQISYTKTRENILVKNKDNLLKLLQEIQIYDLLFSLNDYAQKLTEQNPNYQSIQDLINLLVQQQNQKSITIDQLKIYQQDQYDTLQYRPFFCQIYYFISLQIYDFLRLLNYQSQNLLHLAKTQVKYKKLFQNEILDIQLFNTQQSQDKKQKQNINTPDINSVIQEIKNNFQNFLIQNTPQFTINFLNQIYIKYLTIKQLYYVKKDEILKRFFVQFYKECEQNQEEFFKNLCKGVEARKEFDLCNIKYSKKLFIQSEQYVVQQNIYNQEYALIFGDYAELLISENKIEEGCSYLKKSIYIFRKITQGVYSNSKNTNDNLEKFISYELGENKNRIESIIKNNDFSNGNKQKNQKFNMDKTTKKNQENIEPKTKVFLDSNIQKFQYKHQYSMANSKDLQHNNNKLQTYIYCENQKYLLNAFIKYIQYKLQIYDYEKFSKQDLINNISQDESYKQKNQITKEDIYGDKQQESSSQILPKNLTYILKKLYLLQNQFDYIHSIYSKNYFIRNIHKGKAEYLKSSLNFYILIYNYLIQQNQNLKQYSKREQNSYINQDLFIPQRQIRKFPLLYLYLVKQFLPNLKQIKENLIHSLKYFKEEKVNIEINFSVCNKYNLILKINQFLYKYTESFNFKILSSRYMNNITQKFDIKYNDNDLQQWYQQKQNEYKEFEKNIIFENYLYIKKINEFIQAKQNLKLKFYEIELSKDFNKICEDKLTKDVEYEIQQQKQYSAVKNQTDQNIPFFNEIDLINYFKQLDKENFFVFFNYNYMEQSIKIHKFLTYNDYYMTNFMVEETEINIKSDEDNSSKIQDGTFIFLMIQDNDCQYIQMNYILSKSNSNTNQQQGENQIKKTVQIKENVIKQKYYQGKFKAKQQQIWKLKRKIDKLQDSLNLNSEQKSIEQESDFQDIIIQFGKLFFYNNDESIIKKSEEKLIKFFQKTNEDFFLTQDNLDIIKQILNFGGSKIINDYFLMIFRKLHKLKYENNQFN